MGGAPHDVKAMDTEGFTMEGNVKVKIGAVLVR